VTISTLSELTSFTDCSPSEDMMMGSVMIVVVVEGWRKLVSRCGGYGVEYWQAGCRRLYFGGGCGRGGKVWAFVVVAGVAC